MNQHTQPAPFNLGDHVRYVADECRELPSGHGDDPELVLTPGMEGVVLLSTGALAEVGDMGTNPWLCRVQFQNGFQFDITPENCRDFAWAHADTAAGLSYCQ